MGTHSGVVTMAFVDGTASDDRDGRILDSQALILNFSAILGSRWMERVSDMSEWMGNGVIGGGGVLPIRAQEYQRQRQLSLGDLLLENRIVFLQGEIHDGNANEIVMKLLWLQKENRRKDIHFYINSPGGSVSATLAIYDTMQIVSCSVATYCVGLAASGAAVLLAGGTKGKRYALAHSKMMIHQPYGSVGGQVSDIEIQAEEIRRTRATLNEVLALHTGRPVDEIAKDTDRDFYLSAESAKEYGLVDDVFVRSLQEESKDD